MSKKSTAFVFILFLLVIVTAVGLIFLGIGSSYFFKDQSITSQESDFSGHSDTSNASNDLPAEPVPPLTQKVPEESYIGKISDTHLQNMFYVYNGKKFYSSYSDGSAARVVRTRFSENKSYEDVCTFL
ncbi:hypothetical protein [Methanolapillus millepedarum]